MTLLGSRQPVGDNLVVRTIHSQPFLVVELESIPQVAGIVHQLEQIAIKPGPLLGESFASDQRIDQLVPLVGIAVSNELSNIFGLRQHSYRVQISAAEKFFIAA